MAFLVALCCVCAGPFAARASSITPNWDKLTDFSTNVRISAEHFIAFENQMRAAYHLPPAPLRDFDAHGKIHLNIVGERLKMTSSGHEMYRDYVYPEPHYLAGAEVTWTGEMVFNAPAGFVAVKEHATVSTPLVGAYGSTFVIDDCVNLHFPQGLLPPPAVVQNQLTIYENRVNDDLNHLPPHQDVTVDGQNVALFQSPGLGPNHATHEYVGVLHDGTPVGAGIVPPRHGEWDPAIKFSGWTQGAGDVHEFPCASTSAAEFLARPRANHTLAVFDQMMASMQEMELMRDMLVHFPAQPSLIFKSAAANELSAARDEKHPVVEGSFTVPMVAGAVAAGALGSLLVLAVLKATVKPSRREPLLADVA